jgi:hypothetical protein
MSDIHSILGIVIGSYVLFLLLLCFKHPTYAFWMFLLSGCLPPLAPVFFIMGLMLLGGDLAEWQDRPSNCVQRSAAWLDSHMRARRMVYGPRKPA